MKHMSPNTPGSELFATTRIPQRATHRGIRVVACGSDPGVIFIIQGFCEMAVDGVVWHD